MRRVAVQTPTLRNNGHFWPRLSARTPSEAGTGGLQGPPGSWSFNKMQGSRLMVFGNKVSGLRIWAFRFVGLVN